LETHDVLIAHPSTAEQVDLLKELLKELKIKFEFVKETPYNPDFVAKIQKSKQDYKDGRGKVYSIEELNTLWKYYFFPKQKMILTFG
jgi:hypothetical protein